VKSHRRATAAVAVAPDTAEMNGAYLGTLLDAQASPHEPSPRLEAILAQLSRYTRVRLANAVRNQGVLTLAALCAQRRSALGRWKNVGKKSVHDLEATLAAFGLSFACSPQVVPPAQRGANIVWLRSQIQALVEECEARICQDQALINDASASDAPNSLALTRIETNQRWKRQLERILLGKAPPEDLNQESTPA
jgi:hypothetical protein